MNIECSVCLEPILSQESLVTLECKHHFHRCCIFKLEIGVCPLCRCNIRDISNQLKLDTLVCCKSRCPKGYSPFQKNGECRYCYGVIIPDCV